MKGLKLYLSVVVLGVFSLIRACTMEIINDSGQVGRPVSISLSRTGHQWFFQKRTTVRPGRSTVYLEKWLVQGRDQEDNTGKYIWVRAGDKTYLVGMHRCFIKPKKGHQKLYFSQIKNMAEGYAAHDPNSGVRMGDYLTAVSVTE